VFYEKCVMTEKVEKDMKVTKERDEGHKGGIYERN
jgi:hypothetical protein